MGKSKVLVVGGTGYMGKRIVKACLAQGHETYVLQRREIGLDIDKLQMLLEFKKNGARLVEGSFSDHQSLVDAVKRVDVVISAMSGAHMRSHNLLLQLKLVEAVKEAGNVKRFLPSEFGMDPAKMGNAMEPGRVTFDEKMVVRKAIEEADIPHTYVIANCFAGYFVGNLSQMATLIPPKDSVILYGDGNVKAVYMDEDDVATYTVKTIDDPRALNKTIYVCPPENILSQRELVEKWEKLTGKDLNKHSISGEDFLAPIKESNLAAHLMAHLNTTDFGTKVWVDSYPNELEDVISHGLDFVKQVGIGHFYHIFYEGCLTNFEVKEDQEASKLYPEVQYTSMEDYLKRYL